MSWDDVASVLLTRWPAQKWEPMRLVGYIDELKADGLAVEDAMFGLRASASAFVPSVGEVRTLARKVTDAAQPTFDEMYEALLGKRGILHSPKFEEKAERLHPLVLAFVRQQGVSRLRSTHFEDPDDGHWRRRELRDSWERHVEACEGRDLAALTTGRGAGGLRRIDGPALSITERGAA